MKFCFDCDDTLYDLQWPFKMSIQEVIPSILDTNIDLDAFYHIYRKYGDDVFNELQEGRITIDDSGIYRIYKACEHFGYSIDLTTSCDFQDAYKKYQSKISMSPTFTDYFSSTSSTLAILTNGEDSHQRMKLQALQVFDYFNEDYIFTSGQIGHAKPDARAFHTISSTKNDEPNDWYYIGDNYTNDIEGGHAAGFKTIHFNRHKGKEGKAADYIVYTEQELISLLQTLEKNEKCI